MFFDAGLPGSDSPAWAALYLAGTVALTAWTRRVDFRQGGRAAAIASVDVLGSTSLSVPALAYFDAGIAVRLGDGLLRLLFGLGLLGLLGLLAHGAANALRARHPTPRRRWKSALLAAAIILLPAAPEVWWGAEALAHVYAPPESK